MVRLRNALVGGVTLAFSLAGADLRTATVSGSRPVAKAVEYIEALYGLPITYEDPPYMYDSEVDDVTTQVRGTQGLSNPALPRVLIPRRGALTFQYEALGPRPPKDTAHSAAFQAITDLLVNYPASDGSPRFALIRAPGSIHVVPTRFINGSGRAESLKPMLENGVSLAPKERPAIELLNDICEALSLIKGEKVIVGLIPPWLARQKTSFPVSDMAARSVLDRLFAEIEAPLSWQLFYDPGLHWWALNIHVVSSPTKEATR